MKKAILTIALLLTSLPAFAAQTDIQIVGDSIALRFGPFTSSPYTWTDVIGPLLSLTNVDQGVGGSTCIQAQSGFSYDTSAKYVWIHCGINDANNGGPVGNTETAIASIITTSIAGGSKVILDTVGNDAGNYAGNNCGFTDGSSDSIYVWITGLNSWMVSTYGSNANVYIAHYDTFMAVAGSPWLTTCALTVDGLHPTPSAAASWANLVAEQVQPSVGGNTTMSGAFISGAHIQ